MKVLLFSDLHDSSKGLWAIVDFLNKNKEIGGVIFAGDLVNMGQPLEFAKNFVSEISKLSITLLWVPGNNDFGESYKVLQSYTLSLEGRVVKFGGRKFTGVGGSPDSWSGQYEGERGVNKEEIAESIFISHYPPPGIIMLSKFDDPLLKPEKRFSHSPLVHICGHMHWKWGVSYLGQTKVIELASSETGHCAIMDLESLEVKFMGLI